MGKKRKKSKGSLEKFILRGSLSIGSAQAELDEKYLNECFFDNGDLPELLNISSPKCIILGRTGSGKTALIQKILADNSKAINLPPEKLSFDYISNTTVYSGLIAPDTSILDNGFNNWSVYETKTNVQTILKSV